MKREGYLIVLASDVFMGHKNKGDPLMGPSDSH
jgi:hypothetical protein